MKRYLLLILLLFAQNISAQQIFQKTYNNSADDFFWGIEIANNSDIFLCGYTRENNAIPNKILLSKLNSSGDVLWSKSIDIGNGDAAYKIMLLSNGTLLLTGQTNTPLANYDMLVINADTSGNILWKKNWGSSTSELLETSIETADNFIISIGYPSYQSTYTWGGLKIIKSDLSGNIIWEKMRLFDDSSFGEDLIKVNDTKYVVSGSTRKTGSSDYNILLVEMDSAGSINWSKSYGGSDDEASAVLAKAPGNGYLIATHSESYSTQVGFNDILVIRTDSLGNVIWSKVYGDSENEYAVGIIPDSAGNYIIYGYCASFYPSYPGTGFAMKIDDTGEVVWSRLYGNNAVAFFLDGKQIQNQFILCGQIRSPIPPSNLDGYIVRTDWQGNSGCNDTLISILYSDVLVTTDSISYRDTSSSYAIDFSYLDTALNMSENVLCDSIVDVREYLSDNSFYLYPNPNAGQFFVHFPYAEKINAINIYNMLGESILHIFDFHSSPVNIDLGKVSSGIYVIDITTENKKYFKRVLIH